MLFLQFSMFWTTRVCIFWFFPHVSKVFDVFPFIIFFACFHRFGQFRPFHTFVTFLSSYLSTIFESTFSHFFPLSRSLFHLLQFSIKTCEQTFNLENCRKWRKYNKICARNVIIVFRMLKKRKNVNFRNHVKPLKKAKKNGRCVLKQVQKREVENYRKSMKKGRPFQTFFTYRQFVRCFSIFAHCSKDFFPSLYTFWALLRAFAALSKTTITNFFFSHLSQSCCVKHLCGCTCNRPCKLDFYSTTVEAN